MPLILERFFTGPDGTLGLLFYNRKFMCYILEPPWRDNRPNVSCIPPGSYTVQYLRKSASGKYRDCYWVRNVKNRGAILFHKGNIVIDTKGCLLPGLRVGLLKGKVAVLNSAQAMKVIHKITKRRGFKLHVRDNTIGSR